MLTSCAKESFAFGEQQRSNIKVTQSVVLNALTGRILRQQRDGEILFPLLVQTSPPLKLLLLDGFGHCLQLMLPEQLPAQAQNSFRNISHIILRSWTVTFPVICSWKSSTRLSRQSFFYSQSFPLCICVWGLTRQLLTSITKNILGHQWASWHCASQVF